MINLRDTDSVYVPRAEKTNLGHNSQLIFYQDNVSLVLKSMRKFAKAS